MPELAHALEPSGMAAESVVRVRSPWLTSLVRTSGAGGGGVDPEAIDVALAQELIGRLASGHVVADSEQCALGQSLGRVLAEDVVCPINVPPHDNSAMDGFAFGGDFLARLDQGIGMVRLKVDGTVLAGGVRLEPVPFGMAVRITTGAAMPPGTDTVIPRECVRIDDDQVNFVSGSIRRGDNRRCAGEDLKAGQVALTRGHRLTPAALGLIASLGVAEVTVIRRLRVAYFSTGDEILSIDSAPRAGAVFDSNRYTVVGLLSRLGCEVVEMEAVRDDPVLIQRAVVDAASRADVVITSGGVSMGEADYTRAVLERLGDVAFWRVAIRPGRPLAVGTVSPASPDGSRGAAVLFGLPGNPVAVMVAFLAFVRPAILQMMGCNAASAASPPMLRAKSAVPIAKKTGRTEYQRGFVRWTGGSMPEVLIAREQGSGILRSMVEANGLVVLDDLQEDVAVGDQVNVMMFEGVG